jgi:hypothetical protein
MATTPESFVDAHRVAASQWANFGKGRFGSDASSDIHLPEEMA